MATYEDLTNVAAPTVDSVPEPEPQVQTEQVSEPEHTVSESEVVTQPSEEPEPEPQDVPEEKEITTQEPVGAEQPAEPDVVEESEKEVNNTVAEPEKTEVTAPVEAPTPAPTPVAEKVAEAPVQEPVAQQEPTPAPVVPQVAEPTPEPAPATEPEEKVSVSALMNTISELEKKVEKFGDISGKLDELHSYFEKMSPLEVPDVEPAPAAPQVAESTGEPKSVQSLETGEVERPSIEESSAEPEVAEQEPEPEAEKPVVDINQNISNLNDVYRQISANMPPDGQVAYRTALMHLRNGEGTSKDADTIATLITRFS